MQWTWKPNRPHVFGNDRAPEEEELDQAWRDACRRAFRQLDEWLTWNVVFDDESVFDPEGGRLRNSRFEFALNDVIADPADMLHYCGHFRSSFETGEDHLISSIPTMVRFAIAPGLVWLGSRIW